MMAMLALALALAGPGTERVFGDWAVTCDNIERCEAVAVADAPRGDRGTDDARIARDAGPAGATTVEFWPHERWAGVIAIFVDGKQVAAGYLKDDSLRLAGVPAEGLARAMAAGRKLTLRAGRSTLASYSLAGSSAALRYIDAEQGRADGVTALVAKGAKSAAAVPAAQALPRIAGRRPPKGKPATLAAPALRALGVQGDCDKRPSRFSPAFYRLDARSTLVMVPCSAGARESSHLAFVLRGGKAVPARFDWPPADEKGVPTGKVAQPVAIANYLWANGELTAEPMPFYPGACGSSQTWVWDGEQFRLSLVSRLGVCSRAALWMTAWRAEVRWR